MKTKVNVQKRFERENEVVHCSKEKKKKKVEELPHVVILFQSDGPGPIGLEGIEGACPAPVGWVPTLVGLTRLERRRRGDFLVIPSKVICDISRSGVGCPMAALLASGARPFLRHCERTKKSWCGRRLAVMVGMLRV